MTMEKEARRRIEPRKGQSFEKAMEESLKQNEETLRRLAKL